MRNSEVPQQGHQHPVGALLATKFGPNYVLLLNGLLQLSGNILLLTLGEGSVLFLRVGYFLLGLGCGTAFSNTWLWMEQYFNVRRKCS